MLEKHQEDNREAGPWRVGQGQPKKAGGAWF